MKAVTCKQAELSVGDVEDPRPGKGQLVIEVLRCGICGSDLHARHHCDDVAEVMSETGYEAFMRSDQPVVLGHEFCGEIVEHGPGTKKRDPAGTHVVSLPLIRRGDEVHGIGLSQLAPGAYAERMLVEEALTFPVPNGLPPDLATLTEPMAVGLHAVRKGEVKKKDVAIVIGCGPVGLAVISMLKASGVKQIVASDFSPARRALAARCGADLVVDPADGSPWDGASERGHVASVPDAFGLAIDAMEKLRTLPLPWHRVWQAAEALGPGKPNRPVIFECVGVPGVIDQIVSSAPMFSRVVVVGVCMGDDRIRPSMAINKEIELRFVLGYTPPEFRETLHMIAEGKVDPSALITGEVGLEGVAGAFDALGDPEAHAKILVNPGAKDIEPADTIRPKSVAGIPG